MEAVMENKSEGQIAVPGLMDAEAVSKFLAAADSKKEATVSFPITVSIEEKYGRAFISWAVPSGYALGFYDQVQLREGPTLIKSFAIGGRSGSLDSGHAWGSGLNASYWAASNTVWGSPSSYNLIQLVVTPNT